MTSNIYYFGKPRFGEKNISAESLTQPWKKNRYYRVYCKGTDADVYIEDTCNRSIPIDSRNLPKLIKALKKLQKELNANNISKRNS